MKRLVLKYSFINDLQKYDWLQVIKFLLEKTCVDTIVLNIKPDSGVEFEGEYNKTDENVYNDIESTVNLFGGIEIRDLMFVVGDNLLSRHDFILRVLENQK